MLSEGIMRFVHIPEENQTPRQRAAQVQARKAASHHCRNTLHKGWRYTPNCAQKQASWCPEAEGKWDEVTSGKSVRTPLEVTSV